MWQKIKSFLFENKSVRQTVAKNAFWLSFGQIVSRLIRVGLIIFVARTLGTAGYGIFSYALGLAAFFTIFSDVGVSSILTRESAKDPALMQKYFSTAFAIKLVLIGISALLIIVLAPLFSKIPEVIPILPIVALLLSADGLREFSYAITRAKEKMQIEAGINILTNIVITGIGLFVVFNAPTPFNLTVGYAIGSAIGLIVSAWILRDYFAHPWRHFDKTLVKKILTDAWPFALLGFLGGIMINTDTIMLGWLKTAGDVGLYSAAQRPVQLMYLFPGILSTSLFPSFARFARTDSARFRVILEKVLKLVFLFTLPVVGGGIILSVGIMGTIFGAEYIPAAATFSTLLITLLAVMPATIIGNAVFALNAQKNFVIFLAIGALGNVLFNYLLIPPYGIVGAAIATILAQFLANGFIWLKLKRLTGFVMLPYLTKIIPATIVMVFFTWGMTALGFNVFLNIAGSASIYFIALRVFREPILSDFRALLKLEA